MEDKGANTTGQTVAQEVISKVAELIAGKERVIQDQTARWNADRLELREIREENEILRKRIREAEAMTKCLRFEIESLNKAAQRKNEDFKKIDLLRHEAELDVAKLIQQREALHEELFSIAPWSEETAAWLENRDGRVFPFLLRTVKDHAEVASLSGWPFGKKFNLSLDTQGRTWRLWRRRPTEAERVAAKWKDETEE